MTDRLVASRVVLEALSLPCPIQSQTSATPQRFVAFVLSFWYFVTQSRVTVVMQSKRACFTSSILIDAFPKLYLFQTNYDGDNFVMGQ